ncbi:MAG: hypothetical protein KatS3mg077_2294 [Candidatus Binatia bacterium]|nr:MAG: hypothetical protein KatS3mg077_2294 [Candidatus Binatia bacterium]
MPPTLPLMSRATATALAIVRVPRGAPRPSDDEFRRALEEDRVRLRLEAHPDIPDFFVAGPFPVTWNGQEFDEYVVWER